MIQANTTPVEKIPPPPTERPASRPGLLRFSAGGFLVALVLLFVTSPFIQGLPGGRALDGLLMTVVLLMGVLAVGGQHRTLLVALVLVAPAIAGRWIYHYRPDWVAPEVYLGAGMLFVGFILAELLKFIVRAPRVNSEVLSAGIATYLLLGLLWAIAYMIVAGRSPGAFVSTAGTTNQMSVSFNSVYFSFITLSTCGYGDIIPVSPTARMLAMTEAMTGVLYSTVLIARLVSLYSAPKESAQ